MSKNTESNTLYRHLSKSEQSYLQSLDQQYRLSHQEFRWLCEASKDLDMWQEGSIQARSEKLQTELQSQWDLPTQKQFLLKSLKQELEQLKHSPKRYDAQKPLPAPKRAELSLELAQSDKTIFGDCPVASPKTVCCNLKTIDATENCAYGCSYCTIETFYGSKVRFDSQLAEKLEAIEIDPKRFSHFGTGQSSDSLVWGNKHGNLDKLCNFARKHPNILLEFKTKSANVTYFLEQDIPANVVCSWSLNTETIIENEEHFTASLKQRLKAARKVADKGVKVSFHFHPMVYYEGWQEDYAALAKQVYQEFQTEEVLFISMGSVTFIKPVLKNLRQRGEFSKITQMPLVPDPHGKLTYSDEIKVEQFQSMYQNFQDWHKDVFFYLCMERSEIWDQVWGWHYQTNELFEQTFGEACMRKIWPNT